MATQHVELAANSPWIVASTADEFLIQNTEAPVLFVTLQTDTPSAESAYHELTRGQAITRTGEGTVYVRNPASYAVRVVVTE